MFVVALPDATTTLSTRIAKVIPPPSLPLVIVIATEATLLLVVAIWWLWWRLPKRQVRGLDIQIHDPKARADTEDNFRKTVGQALGGAAVLIGAVAAYLQFTQQQRASHDLLISSQVSKGLEQLANDKITERLGGIYALEGVMNTSDQYHKPVLEALCAFVRESTTREKGPLTILLQALVTAPRGGTADKANDKPPNDIQAALTVIGRRKPGDGYVNLTGAIIQGTDLIFANLSDATLMHTNLVGANLRFAKLSSATLIGANLGGAYLENANLSSANLAGANLGGANLGDANLGRAYLSNAELSSVTLIGANLHDANLSNAKLSSANLVGANLHDADLSGANLSEATDVTQAQLDQACGKPKALPPGMALDKPCPDAQ